MKILSKDVKIPINTWQLVDVAEFEFLSTTTRVFIKRLELANRKSHADITLVLGRQDFS
jgi:hypothetical protein